MPVLLPLCCTLTDMQILRHLAFADVVAVILLDGRTIVVR